MKILWVKSGGLLPLDHGGRIRSFNLAKELAKSHEVSIFTFYPPTPDDPQDQLKQIFSQVHSVPITLPQQRGAGEYVAYAKNILSGLPYSVTKYCQPHVTALLRKHLLAESYDLIVCDFLLTAQVIPWDLPGSRVLFTHNVETQIWERLFRVARNPIWRAVCYREYRTMQRMELRYLQRSDHVLAVSETDANFFERILDPSNISVIPTGVDVEYFRPTPEKEEANALVFTGSMDWLANEDGILYFMREILPRIRQEIPDATLWVVGRRPSKKLIQAASELRGIEVTGTVEDIRPYIAKASVYIVPLLVGGGTRLKIFEAMAMGRAIVSTSIGAEGLPAVSGKHLLLADQPEEFARQVVELLRDTKRRKELGERARSLVEQNYSWQSVGNLLSDVLRNVSEKSLSAAR
jgi:sugar transferase (PEP-CTERM/EpsH1 system associated)